jgi:fibronectin-binding autotransporter adhesin
MTRSLWKACAEAYLAKLGGRTCVRVGILLAICLTPILGFAQNDDWLGGTGYWSTASQWSAGVPTSSSNAIIGSDGASAVTINYNGAQCAGLTIDGGDSLTLVDGTIFTVFGPTISNAGLLSMNAISGSAILDINGAVTLSGSGGLTMSNNANNELMGYAQPNGAAFTNQTTIQGAGNIGSPSGGSFVNQGTVNANQTTPLMMSVGPGAVTNTGTLEATNGATLALSGGTVTNTAGTIHADPASAVTLTNVTVSGGTLTTSGTGTIQANCCLSYSTLNGVTLNGTYQLNNNNIGYLQGTITNNGSMQINATGSSGTFLDIVGAVTLKGSGTLTMSNNANNALMGYAQANGASLTNQITVEGAGSITPPSGDSFINQATVNANQTTPLLITASGTVTNTGTLEATNGATLELDNGTITNTGGVIHADSASIVSLYGATVSGGTLTTSGTGIIEAVCCQGYSTLDGVTVDGAFQWVSNNIGYLHGTITNNGPMTFKAPSGTSVVLNVDGAVTLNGKGTLTSTNANNEIMGYAQTSGSLLNQSTIEGTVQFGIGAGNSLTNEGTIYANQKTSLFIDANQGTFTNTGTLKVKTGSVLYIQGGGFTNFSGTTFTGGKYLVNGTLEFDGADIVTNAANITLTGAKSAIINQSGANGLASFATNTKTGSFSLMSGALLNSTVTSGNFSNAGKVTVGVKGNFQISAPQPNTATYTQTAGTTTVDGTLSATGGVTIQAGKLYGKGTIATSVVSSGSVTAGDSATKPGVLSPSTYVQNASGSLNIAVGGLDVGTQYGQLAVANGASLNGTLNIKLINSFVPVVGNTFVIATGSAFSGTFATVNGLSINGSEHFTITYNPTNVTLTVVSGT